MQGEKRDRHPVVNRREAPIRKEAVRKREMGCQSKGARVKAPQGLGEQENNTGKGERRD